MNKNFFVIKYAKLNLPCDIENLQSETNKVMNENNWFLHLNQSHYTGNWEVLALRSPGGNSKSITADIMNEGHFADTHLMQQFPSVQKRIEHFQCPIMSVRLLNLKAGAIIKSHRDVDLCFEKGEARIHFPIFTNRQVEFIIEEERLEMKEGESWYINANRMHSVANLGTTDRIHLVIDCQVNDWLKKVFDQSEKVLIDEKPNTVEIQKIINELRLQNTEAANKIADDLLQKIQS